MKTLTERLRTGRGQEIKRDTLIAAADRIEALETDLADAREILAMLEPHLTGSVLNARGLIGEKHERLIREAAQTAS